MILRPQPGPQEDFLSCEADIAIYGGAAGSGKTFSIILDPIRFVSDGEAGAVVFRRNTTQVRNEGGLWDESSKVYPHVKGKPRETTLDWIFPSGFKIKYSHLEHEKTVLDYQGSQIPIIYFDELTHFTKKQFFYMLTRNRSTSSVRPYVRATTNPDSKSWVRQFLDWWIGEDGYPIPERAGVLRWFIILDDKTIWANTREELISAHKGCEPKSVTFIPAKLSDNKILMDKDPGYLANLLAQDKVTREQLLGGNWNIAPSPGEYFKRGYFEEVDAHPPLVRIVRCWDRAATEYTGDNNPDYTAGLKLGKDAKGIYYIMDLELERISAYKVETLIKNTATRDGTGVAVKGFQDPGSAGKGEIEAFIKMLAGYEVVTERLSVDKVTAAKPASAQAEAGNIKVLSSCRNKEDLYNQLENFPGTGHDDVVDAFSGAFNFLALGRVGSFDESFDHNEKAFDVGNW